jgi:ABC-type uncharacterized transport system substrate-binding protein
MRRRELILGLGGALALPGVASAAGRRMPVIGMLAYIGGMRFSSFQKGLRETGFVDGRNVRIDFRDMHGRYDQMPAMAADLVRRKVAVIVAFGSVAAHAAKRATATIPIVFWGYDPLEEGLVANLARPGGNLTGVSLMAAELVPKRLELLSELVPQAKAFALLVAPIEPATSAVIHSARRAARAKGIALHVVKAGSRNELFAAFDRLPELAVGGLIVDFNATFSQAGGTIAALAAVGGVPAIYGWSDIVEAGGLISYSASISRVTRLLGLYTGRILKGERPADLPVVRPDKFELAVNLKAARNLGLKVPPSLLVLADEVIE